MPGIWDVLSVVGIVFGGLIVLLVLGTVARLMFQRMDQARLQTAKDEFRLRREWLEAEFLTAASKSGKPRGLEWTDCDFQNEVSFCRDRHNGQLCALVGVAISFDAVEGGGMEDNPNVDLDKAGSVLFRYDGQHWSTDGRALLNLEPNEAIQHLHNELETVD